MQVQSTPRVNVLLAREDRDRCTLGSAGAMTDLGECAKPAPRNLNGAPHAAVSENELSLHVVHPCHI